MFNIYYDMPEEQYFRSESLSASGCKALLPPSCPALFAWYQSNPTPAKPAFDHGKAAHELVLGKGGGIVEIEFNDWRTNAAKAARQEAYEKGQTPLLSKDARRVEAMAAELAEHPIASELLKPGAGKAEVTIFWLDRPTGIRRRARIDYLRPDSIVDYKSCAYADLESVTRAAFKYNYHMQSGSYEDAVVAAELSTFDMPYYLVWQQKTAPYLVTVQQVSPEVIAEGRRLNREAIETYQRCMETGRWPGYSDSITILDLPDKYNDWTGLADDDDTFNEEGF
jgi:hypothetical protein